MADYDALKIQNQLCFPLYVCSKEIIKKYTPLLKKYDLTYTQYITLMVLWDVQQINVKSLGDKLFLDSGTLTPVLKKMEYKGYIERQRLKSDERNVVIKITKLGINLKNELKDIPLKVGKCVNLTSEESMELYRLLYKILGEI